MGWIFSLARLPPIKFLPPAGLLPAVHSHWCKSKASLHDCSCAKFPSFHPSSQPECALSELLLWCCIRQFWNNNLKTALKPAKGKTSSHYCAIVQIICCGFAGNLEMGTDVPKFEIRGWLAASDKELHKSQSRAKLPPPLLNWSPLWVQTGWTQPCQSCCPVSVLNNGELRGGKNELFVCVCVHLSIRELKLGMRDECWGGT